MFSQRGLGYVLMLIGLITLPTAAALGWWQYTGDPTLRPLGITREAIRTWYNSWTSSEIVAVVDWDPADSDGFTKEDLGRALRGSFHAKGVDVWVKYREMPGIGATRVTFIVGASTIGPYLRSRAAEGVNAAVAAYRMKVPYKPR